MQTTMTDPQRHRPAGVMPGGRTAESGETEQIVSTLSTVPAMKTVLGEFVASLPAELEKLLDAGLRNDLVAMRRVVHQLRGACGGYGFDALSVRAAEVEELFRASRDRAAIDDGIRSLVALVRRVQGFGAGG